MTGVAGDPTRFAATVAPVVDDVVTSVHRAGGPALAPVRARHGYDLPLGVLLELRLPLLRGPVAAHTVAAVFRFRPDRDALVAAQVAGGWLTRRADGSAALSAKGARLLLDVLGAYDRLLDDLWAHRAASHGALLSALDAAVAGAVAAPGGAFEAWRDALVGGPGGPALHVWHCLVALRYHRADAHAEAGEAVGLTAEDMAAGRAGELAAAVERGTDERAAAAWAGLTPAARAAVLADLRALVPAAPGATAGPPVAAP